MPIWLYLLLAIFLSAFFSGMEIAFVSANRLKIELDKNQGRFAAKILSFFFKSPEKFIGTMLLGNNISLVIYSMLMVVLIEPLIVQYVSNTFLVLLFQTVVSTFFVLIFAEFLPKALLRINPNRTLFLAAIPLRIVYWVLYPFTYFTVGVSNLILRLFKVDTSESDVVFSKVDLEHFVTDIQERQEEGDDIENEIKIFKNALDFPDLKARECMIPRTEIVAMSVDCALEELQDKFITTGLSKVLIYRDSIDNIIGYIHSKELFKKPASITSILLPISIIPEAMSANEVLKLFIKNRRSIGVIVGEFGGTSGIITTEDIIEEIFGEIEDEHDKEALIENQLDEYTYQFSARTEIDYINNKYKLALPESEGYETLAGLIINISESIPEKGEVIYLDPFSFIVDKVSDNRIELITIKIAE